MNNTNAGGGGGGTKCGLQGPVVPHVYSRSPYSNNSFLNTLRYHYIYSFRAKTIVFSSFEHFFLSSHQWLFESIV